MINQVWNSSAALSWPGDGGGSVIAVGRLFEMVNMLLSMPTDMRDEVELSTELWHTPLRHETVQALRQRGDFPVLV